MTLPAWPDPRISAAPGSSGGPVDARVAFEPAIGAPIARPATTARVERWSITTHPFETSRLAAFEAWFDGVLGMGSLAFAWVHPVTGDARVCQFAPGAAYTVSRVTRRGWLALRFDLLILPGEVPA